MSTESHTLHTYTTSASDGRGCDVFWKLGNRIGHISMVAKDQVDLSDTGAAAELCAIHFLLSTKEVMGGNRSGRGIILEVSKGVIRKLALGTSQKKDLMPFTVFLATRYQEASIRVGKKANWIPTEMNGIETDVVVMEPVTEVIETPVLGKVAITKHAFEQYQERFQDGEELGRAWTSLTKQLQHSGLERISLPPRVLAHKLARYGDKASVVWRHPTGTLHFALVAGEGGRQTLVTVFYRNDTKLSA